MSMTVKYVLVDAPSRTALARYSKIQTLVRSAEPTLCRGGDGDVSCLLQARVVGLSTRSRLCVDQSWHTPVLCWHQAVQEHRTAAEQGWSLRRGFGLWSDDGSAHNMSNNEQARIETRLTDSLLSA